MFSSGVGGGGAVVGATVVGAVVGTVVAAELAGAPVVATGTVEVVLSAPLVDEGVAVPSSPLHAPINNNAASEIEALVRRRAR